MRIHKVTVPNGQKYTVFAELRWTVHPNNAVGYWETPVIFSSQHTDGDPHDLVAAHRWATSLLSDKRVHLVPSSVPLTPTSASRSDDMHTTNTGETNE